MNFRIVFSIFMKNNIGMLIGIILNLYMAFGSKDVLTKLNCPIHEHGITFHLSVSF